MTLGLIEERVSDRIKNRRNLRIYRPLPEELPPHKKQPYRLEKKLPPWYKPTVKLPQYRLPYDHPYGAPYRPRPIRPPPDPIKYIIHPQPDHEELLTPAQSTGPTPYSQHGKQPTQSTKPTPRSPIPDFQVSTKVQVW